MEFKVLVNTFEKVEDFVTITNNSLYDIDLVSGKHIYLDAKSMMGILSCNIAEPMTIIVNCNDEAENGKLRAELEKYIV